MHDKIIHIVNGVEDKFPEPGIPVDDAWTLMNKKLDDNHEPTGAPLNSSRFSWKLILFLIAGLGVITATIIYQSVYHKEPTGLNDTSGLDKDIHEKYGPPFVLPNREPVDSGKSHTDSSYNYLRLGTDELPPKKQILDSTDLNNQDKIAKADAAMIEKKLRTDSYPDNIRKETPLDTQNNRPKTYNNDSTTVNHRGLFDFTKKNTIEDARKKESSPFVPARVRGSNVVDKIRENQIRNIANSNPVKSNIKKTGSRESGNTERGNTGRGIHDDRKNVAYDSPTQKIKHNSHKRISTAVKSGLVGVELTDRLISISPCYPRQVLKADPMLPFGEKTSGIADNLKLAFTDSINRVLAIGNEISKLQLKDSSEKSKAGTRLKGILPGKSEYGLQWNLPVATQGASGYIAGKSGKSVPVNLIVPEIWVSRKLGRYAKSNIQLSVNFMNQYLTGEKTISDSDGAASQFDSTLVKRNISLLKLTGISPSLMYNYNFSSRWSGGIGVGYGFFGKAFLNRKTTRVSDGQLLSETFDRISKTEGEWRYFKSNLIFGKIQLSYSFQKFCAGATFLMPLKNLSNNPGRNIQGLNGQVFFRWRIK